MRPQASGFKLQGGGKHQQIWFANSRECVLIDHPQCSPCRFVQICTEIHEHGLYSRQMSDLRKPKFQYSRLCIDNLYVLHCGVMIAFQSM